MQLAGFSDEVTHADRHGDRPFLLANRDAPRGQVLEAAAATPSLAAARIVVLKSV